MGLMEKIFGDINTKEVKKVEKIANQVMALEDQMAALTDDAGVQGTACKRRNAG